MKCKNCNTEILYKIFGLRDFCSDECKAEYRRAYLRFKAQKRRKTKKTKVSINSSVVYKSKPTAATIYNPEKGGSETIYNSYGGELWYDIAKKYCFNFKLREKEGYCVTRSEPQRTFRYKCSDCPLGKVLMNVVHGTRQEVV